MNLLKDDLSDFLLYHPRTMIFIVFYVYKKRWHLQYCKSDTLISVLIQFLYQKKESDSLLWWCDATIDAAQTTTICIFCISERLQDFNMISWFTPC